MPRLHIWIVRQPRNCSCVTNSSIHYNINMALIIALTHPALHRIPDYGRAKNLMYRSALKHLNPDPDLLTSLLLSIKPPVATTSAPSTESSTVHETQERHLIDRSINQSIDPVRNSPDQCSFLAFYLARATLVQMNQNQRKTSSPLLIMRNVPTRSITSRSQASPAQKSKLMPGRPDPPTVTLSSVSRLEVHTRWKEPNRM